MYTSSLKRETRWFHVVVVQQRQRNEQKCVMFVQSCCFVLLCRSPCPPRRRCISSLKDERAAPFLFSRRIALGTRMDLLYGLRSTRVVTRLLLLDMQRALYLWPNSSYTQDMEKGSVLEPGFCLGLCCWEIHTLILLNIKKGPETGRQPSVFNPVSMGYHWKKTWKGLSPRPCSGKREQTHITGKGTNDTFGPASTQCKQAITRHVILRKMYRTTFSC